MENQYHLDLSYITCIINDDGLLETNVLGRDLQKSLDETLGILKFLFEWPLLRTDFGHSGDKAQLVVSNKVITLYIYFESNAIRYEPTGEGFSPSFGRCSLDVMETALQLLASNESPLELLKTKGNLEEY